MHIVAGCGSAPTIGIVARASTIRQARRSRVALASGTALALRLAGGSDEQPPGIVPHAAILQGDGVDEAADDAGGLVRNGAGLGQGGVFHFVTAFCTRRAAARCQQAVCFSNASHWHAPFAV